MKQTLSRLGFAALAATLVVAVVGLWRFSQNDTKMQSPAKTFAVAGVANGTPWAFEIGRNDQAAADPESESTQLMQSATDAENDSAPLMQMGSDAENESTPLMRMATDVENDSTPLMQMATDAENESTPQMQMGP